jgi:hypothetical protein
VLCVSVAKRCIIADTSKLRYCGHCSSYHSATATAAIVIADGTSQQLLLLLVLLVLFQQLIAAQALTRTVDDCC